jgi:hypothetical protein
LAEPKLLGAPRPAPGELHRPSSRFEAHRIFDTFIERHDDVGAEGQLDFDGALGREKVRRAVEVRPEVKAVFGHPSQTLQAHHLEAAAVG